MDLQNEVQGLTIKESENNIELAITQAFVQVLYADEAVKINEGTVEVSKAQRDRGKALLEAGALSSPDNARKCSAGIETIARIRGERPDGTGYSAIDR